MSYKCESRALQVPYALLCNNLINNSLFDSVIKCDLNKSVKSSHLLNRGS